MPSTWFITGASRGIGRELAEQALARGDRVAATLRHPEHLDDLAAIHDDRFWVRQLDVTDTVQMGRVIKEAFTDHERIDPSANRSLSNGCRGVRPRSLPP